MCTSVKFHRKYYDDCAQILTEHMLAARKPKSKVSFSALAPLLATMEDPVDFWGGKSNNKKKKHPNIIALKNYRFFVHLILNHFSQPDT